MPFRCGRSPSDPVRGREPVKTALRGPARRRRAAAAVVVPVVVAALVLVAGGGTSAYGRTSDTKAKSAKGKAAKALKIGFLPPTLQIDALQQLEKGVEKYAGDKYGDTVDPVD